MLKDIDTRSECIAYRRFLIEVSMDLHVVTVGNRYDGLVRLAPVFLPPRHLGAALSIDLAVARGSYHLRLFTTIYSL